MTLSSSERRVPVLFFDVTDLDVGTIEVGQSIASTVMLTNEGSDPVELLNFDVFEFATEWSIQPAGGVSLPVTMAGGASVGVEIVYQPTFTGAVRSRLTPKTADDVLGNSVLLRGAARGPEGDEFRINAGGDGFLEASGEYWSTDYSFSGGYEAPSLQSFGPGAELLDDQRGGEAFAYRLTLPQAGVYEVELTFGEDVYTNPGERLFDVQAEGAVVLDDFDIVERAGFLTPWVESFRVPVTDGELNLDFIASVTNAKVAAVRVSSVGELTITPDEHNFGALGAGQVTTVDLDLTNAGATALTIDIVRLALGPAGVPASFSLALDGEVYPGFNETVTQLVGLTLAAGETETATLSFAPTEERYDSMDLEFAGSFGVETVRVTGLGGHDGDPFLHVVIDTERTFIDYDGDGQVNCLFEGSFSHTHEPGRVLTDFEWFVDGASVSTLPTDQVTLALGSYDLELVIGDDGMPQRTLAGTSSILVETPQRVPGVLAKYYDATGVGPLTLIDALPPNASFAEVTDSTYIGGTTTIGGSPYSGDVVVTLVTRAVIDEAGDYFVLPVGGAANRLWVDGTSYTMPVPISLTVGEHLFEMAFAVEDMSDAPLFVQILRQNGTQLPVAELRHDQTALNPVLNSLPPRGSVLGGNSIVLRGLGFFPAIDVEVNWGAVTLTHADFTSIQPNEIRFVAPAQPEGFIGVSVTTPIGTSNVRSYEYDVDGPVAMDFWTKLILPVDDPTAATWGHDGRLYVSSLTGALHAFEFDENYDLVQQLSYPGIFALDNHDVGGLATNPWDDPNGPVKIYVAHAKHYVNDGNPFPTSSPFTGQISLLEGPNFDTPVPVMTGLPTSNHDHAVFAISFDNQGRLLINIGGNTNAGVPDPASGNLPESPLSGAILWADVNDPAFDGTIRYADPQTGEYATPDQLDGHEMLLVATPSIGWLATGIRNPYDHVYTTWGELFATDNGPNFDFGPASVSLTTQGPDPFDEDRLVLVERGNYYGHPNRSRGRFDDRQNVYRGWGQPSIPNEFSQALVPLNSSTNGIIEYRADAFAGQLRGDLLVQQWYSWISRIQLTENRRGVVSVDEFAWTGGLALEEGWGGAIFGLDYNNDALRVLVPIDPTAPSLIAYDISPWRAPATGGTPFVIGGRGFGDLGNTTVTIGGIAATLTEVTPTRIRGITPQNRNITPELVDVEVTVGAAVDVYESGFRYLYPIGDEPFVRESLAAPVLLPGATNAEALGSTLVVLSDDDNVTRRYDLYARQWISDGAPRPAPSVGSATTAFGDDLFVFGGATAPSAIQRYSSEFDTWNFAGTLPWSVTDAFAVGVGDLVIVGGGRTGGVPNSTIQLYDPDTQGWVALPNLPVGVFGATAGNLGNSLFVFGGDDGTGATDLVQRLDLVTLSWTSSVGGSIPALPAPRAFCECSPYHFGSFYLAGGLDDSGNPLDTMVAFEVDADTGAMQWLEARKLSEARSSVGIASFEAHLFAIGGAGLTGASSAFETYRE